MGKKPSWYRCTESQTKLFTVGTAYEVHSHADDGRPWVCTDHDRIMRKLPTEGAQFEPHDPWAYTRKGPTS